MEQFLSNEEAKQQILLLFDGYLKRKNNKTLYQHNDVTPVVILKTYFAFVEKRDYSDIINTFRKKYIYNENKNEDVHERAEQLGMGVMYDYISEFDNYNNLNIYTLLDLHLKLYSKVPYPELGGKFRVEDSFLTKGPIDVLSHEYIPEKIRELYLPVQELIKYGVSIKYSNDANQILNYINQCIKLKCDLIKIHPFKDGNGRSVRAFINLLFKIANIPPTYIKTSERDEYIEAMNKANGDGDYSDILTFYYYKICDSILELDIKNLEKEEQKKL